MIRKIKKKRGSLTDLSSMKTYKKEMKKDRVEKIIIAILLTLSVLTTATLLIFLSTNLLMTGYASYVEARGGYITYLDVEYAYPTAFWSGVYGLALRVPGFTEQLYSEIDSGEIVRQDLFFECMQTGVTGGNEVFATLSSTPDLYNLIPANISEIDDYIVCSGEKDCADNTFKMNMSILLGGNNISYIPSTYTYKFDGNNTEFDIGIMKDSLGNLVYVSHKVGTIGKGFSPNKTINYQMMLPTPQNTTSTYYFFTDPNDDCPEGGGIGESINSTVFGYVQDNSGNAIPNASVVVAGSWYTSESDGWYNISFVVLVGTYNLFAMKTGYNSVFENVSVNFTHMVEYKNLTMTLEGISGNESINPLIWGYVKDTSGNLLDRANVSLGGVWTGTNDSGYYSFSPTILPVNHEIIAIREGYDNYYYTLNFSLNTTEVHHNATLEAATILAFPTGPYTTAPVQAGVPPVPIEEIEEAGEDYWVSTKEIKKEVRQNTFVEETIGIYNFKASTMGISYTLSENVKDFIKLDKPTDSIPSNSFRNLIVTIYGTKPVGIYNGSLTISGDVSAVIPIEIKIVERKFPIETLLIDVSIFKKVYRPGEKIKYRINLQNLLTDQSYQVFLKSLLTDNSSASEVYAQTEDSVEIENTISLLKELTIPEDVEDGDYVINVEAKYMNLFSVIQAPLKVAKPIYLYSFFGIPLWLILLIISFLSFLFLNFFLYRRHSQKKKRYRTMLDFASLPKAADRTVKLGLVAETKTPAFLEMERLTTHTIVAGATGMGKSISAQVLIEELLMKNIAIIVFDPTAQWSGMLRKCTDKRMFSYYPKFGLKETDSRAFLGSIRQVKDARQVIDVMKHTTPGQIQIFTLNRLDPKDIDMFIANIIRQVFKSDPKESPELRLMLVFDEVHRLLSKFGGSGEGFLQIERAAREFRKWGIGLMLISQVLSDFVGEIKANINTEIQTRTIEESDLERIKTKYGEEYLKSLVKAEVGVAMFQNAEYNKGRPYFINFRPILHNTRRLTDAELDKYDNYNELIDDFEYQIEQLEELKIDTFDIKMELKLVKDKVMSGNFAIVDIYLEGLQPRLEKEWKKIGKKPKKKQLQLVSESDIKKSVEEAKKQRKEVEKEEKEKKAKEKK